MLHADALLHASMEQHLADSQKQARCVDWCEPICISIPALKLAGRPKLQRAPMHVQPCCASTPTSEHLMHS